MKPSSQNMNKEAFVTWGQRWAKFTPHAKQLLTVPYSQ